MLFVLLFGFLLRFYKVSEIPTGFFADEAANGYNAYKLLTTGKDEYGVSFPFYFQSFGDYRTPVAIYSMIPSIFIFGLNQFSVRFTMVIYGTLTILFLYLFVKELFWNEQSFIKDVIALSSSLFLAISPWHIHFSRSGFEFIPMPFYLIVGLFFLFRFLHRTQKPINLVLSTIFFIITFYTAYVVQIVLIPFLFCIFLLYRKKNLNKKILKISLISLIFFLLGLIPFITATLSGQALTRFNSVSPFSHGKNLKDVLKPMAKTYIDHFQLDFLFLKGDIDMPRHFISRHSLKGIGELYLFQLPLLILGIFYLFLKYKKILIFSLVFLILYPIGSTIIAEEPFAHRSLFGVVPFQILSAIGLTSIFYFLSKIITNSKLKIVIMTIMICFFVIICSLSLKDYVNKYFNEYPLYSSDFWGWQYGPKETMQYFLSVKNNYDELYMSGEFNSGNIFLKFYDPKNTCQNKCMLGDFWRNPKIYNSKKRQLFSLSPEYLKNSSLSNRFIVKKIIFYPNKTIAFQIGEIVE